MNNPFLPTRAAYLPPPNVFDWDGAGDDDVTIQTASDEQPILQTSSLAQPVVGPVEATGTLITAGGITFDLLFDAAALAAPAAFRTQIKAAATMLADVITDKITVNLQIHYSGTGGGASAKPDSGLLEPYNTTRDDLVNAASPGDPTFASLPTGTSIQGQTQVAVWNSELKVFGLLSANDTTTDDGEATFATDIPDDLLVGVALHELTHALGRVPYGPQPDIFDLFRFTSAGTRLFTDSIPAAAAYFSIDGGNTKLADFGENSDPSDFLNSGVQGPNDPFNEYYSSTTVQSLTGVDVEMLDSLGFHVHTAGSVSISLKNDNGASSTDKLTNDATLTGAGTPNATVTLTENGNSVGTAAVSAAGVWTAKPSLGDGQHTIVASIGGQTASLTFTLATHAPTLNALESVSGQTTLTSDTITVTALAEAVGANAIAGVEIFDGAADLGAATLSNGVWSYTAGNLLPGAHSFTAKASDAAGNAATASLATVTVTGSTPPPTANYTLSAFAFTGSGVTDIRAKSVNDYGEVVGYYIDNRPDDAGADGQTYYEHGFYSTVSGGTRSYTSIDNPAAVTGAPGPVRTRAFGVNDKGDVVGWYGQDVTGVSSAGDEYILPDAGFIMAQQWPQTFGELGFSALNDLGTHALGINATDQIVGYYVDGAGEDHGFFRAFTGYGVRGGYSSFDPTGSINTIAEGINDSNLIVGFYESADTADHGFAYNISTGAFTPIDFNGAKSTEVLGVNDGGEMVGFYIDTSGARHGFVRSASGQFATVDDPNAGSGGTLVGGINNYGEIVGWYTGANGHDSSFLGAPALPTLSIGSAAGASTLTLSGAIDIWDVGDPIGVYDGSTLLTSTAASVAGAWAASVNIAGNGVHRLVATAANAAGPSYSNALVDLVNASTNLSGGSQFVLFGTTGDTVGLASSGGAWDTVWGSSGVVNVTTAQASVIGGGDTLNFAGSGDAASLYNTNGAFDTVYAASASLYLSSAQVSILGGGDAIYTDGAASDVVSLYNTSGNWDTVYSANAQVYLTSAQASVLGGSNTIYGLSGSALSLYNTGGAWDTLYGSSDQIYVAGAQASVLGGGDAIYAVSGASISLYNTNGNWDTVYGSGETVYLTGAQASILGGGNAISGASGSSIGLYNTGSNVDGVSGSGDLLSMVNAQATVSGNANHIYFSGSNALIANGGSDHFHFAAQMGLTVIADFGQSDVIHLAASDWASYAALQGSGDLQQSGVNTQIKLDASDVVTLLNVNPSTLSSANFAFA